MRIRFLVLSVAACVMTSLAHSQHPLVVQVRNPSGLPWVEAPFTVPIAAGETVAGLGDPNGLILAGKDILPVQADDLDGDGKPDEIVFLASLAPGDESTYTLQANTRGWVFPKRAHTGMYKKGFEGPGWESDRIAYRLYWDERNAIDIFGKHKPMLGLNGYASPGINYHRETPWGMDILKVGPSLGMGSYGIWLEGKIQDVAKARRDYKVIADGPLRAILDLNYDEWIAGSRRFHLKARISMIASQRWAEIELRLRPLDDGPIPEFVTGVVKHDETALIQDAKAGILGRWGLQALGPGEKPKGSHLGLGVVVDPKRIVKIEEDTHSSYLRLKGEEIGPAAGVSSPGNSSPRESVLRYRIHASWIQESGGADSAQSYEAMLRDLAGMMAQPGKASIIR